MRSLAIPLLGAACVLATAVPAAAAEYAAIAFSQASGAFGYYHGADSQARAEEGALQECGAGCQVVIWTRDACAALAVGRGDGYGTYWSTNESAVENGAMAECRKRTSDCELKVMTCATH